MRVFGALDMQVIRYTPPETHSEEHWSGTLHMPSVHSTLHPEGTGITTCSLASPGISRCREKNLD